MRNVFLVLSILLVFSSCTQDEYSGVKEDESNGIVLPAKSDSTGIVIGGSDIGFDDDDSSTTSIDNPTISRQRKIE